jgi:hypothetical protein
MLHKNPSIKRQDYQPSTYITDAVTAEISYERLASRQNNDILEST